MAKGRGGSNFGKSARQQNRVKAPAPQQPLGLYELIQAGREYESLIQAPPKPSNLRDELRRGIADIEAIRGRPMFVYAANSIGEVPGAGVAIVASDDLPFAEMIGQEPANIETVDILIATPGGSANQVAAFVDNARRRFAEIDFFVPHSAMSAGTLWALSGNKIWMDERAHLGPIDPQVYGKNGQLLPAQSLQLLVKQIQDRGDERLKAGQQPDWTDVQILRNIDPKELGTSLSGSNYSIDLAAQYIEDYKFSGWLKHSDGSEVTSEQRASRAREIASELCSHDRWKEHSHGIARDVAWNELRLKISEPESVEGLNEAIRRFWAMLYWVFTTTQVTKIFLSQRYSVFKHQPVKSK